MKKGRLTIRRSEVWNVLHQERKKRRSPRSQRHFLAKVSNAIKDLGSPDPLQREQGKVSLRDVILKYCEKTQGAYIITSILELMDVGDGESISKGILRTRNLFLEALNRIENEVDLEESSTEIKAYFEERQQTPKRKNSGAYTGIIDLKLKELFVRGKITFDELEKFFEVNLVHRWDSVLMRHAVKAFAMAYLYEMQSTSCEGSRALSEVRLRAEECYKKIRPWVLKFIPECSEKDISIVLKSFKKCLHTDHEAFELIKKRVTSDDFLETCRFSSIPSILKNMAFLGIQLNEDEVILLVDIYENEAVYDTEIDGTKKFLHLSRLAMALMIFQHDFAECYVELAQSCWDQDPMIAAMLKQNERQSFLELKTEEVLRKYLGSDYEIERNVHVALFEVDFRIRNKMTGAVILIEADGAIYHDHAMDIRRDQAIMDYSPEQIEKIIRLNPSNSLHNESVVKNAKCFEEYVLQELVKHELIERPQRKKMA